jgi:hypothetical protein
LFEHDLSREPLRMSDIIALRVDLGDPRRIAMTVLVPRALPSEAARQRVGNV